MGTVIVDGIEVAIGDHERLNGIEAARRAGIEIPHYCWHAGLSVVASCRMCLVESGTRNAETGEINVVPKLVPACQTPAKDNTVFVTNSDRVKQSRAFVEEALLMDHPIDCPICDKAGECHLQDYYFEHGQAQRRADIRPFTSKKRDVGPTVTLFVDRCVMCTRCVRFTREISGTSELMVIDRGSHDEIDVFPGHPLDNRMSGNVVDLCPVGALGDKDFLYEQRVWFMEKHDGVCTGCSTGCSIYVEENQDTVYRLKPRENPRINQWWMCDEGRYGYHHVHSTKRLVGAVRRDRSGTTAIEWEQVFTELPKSLASAGPLAAVLSPHLTVEEAYLLATYIRGLDPAARLVVGPAPIEGTDETFPNGFTIRAEKCPNRRGVEEIVKHFGCEAEVFEAVQSDMAAGLIGGVWVSGGYKTDTFDSATATTLSSGKFLIVQDLFASPLMEAADYQLPGPAFPEREGSYVNAADRLQTVPWAIRSPAGVRTDGSVLWRLLGRPGMYRARAVLDEIAATIPYFGAAAAPVPPHGVALAEAIPATTTT